MWQTPSFLFPIRFPNQIFLRKKTHSVAKKWSWENCLHVLSFPNSGNSSTKLLTLAWMHVPTTVDFSVQIPKGFLKVIFQQFFDLKINRSISHASEYCLCIGVEVFLWMVQDKSRFWNLKRVDGTIQEFGSGTFRVCKFQNCLLAKYFISVNCGSCSQKNFVHTAVEEKLRNRSFAAS